MRETNAPLRKSELIQVEGKKKGRGRPKIKLVEGIKKDMLINELTELTSLDRVAWKKRIHMADPN